MIRALSAANAGPSVTDPGSDLVGPLSGRLTAGVGVCGGLPR